MYLYSGCKSTKKSTKVIALSRIFSPRPFKARLFYNNLPLFGNNRSLFDNKGRLLRKSLFLCLFAHDDIHQLHHIRSIHFIITIHITILTRGII